MSAYTHLSDDDDGATSSISLESESSNISDRLLSMKANSDNLRARASQAPPPVVSDLRDIVSLGKVSIERDGKDSLVHFDTGQGLACCL